MSPQFRITVRGEGVELRGHIPLDHATLQAFAAAMVPFGMVFASVEEPEEEP